MMTIIERARVLRAVIEELAQKMDAETTLKAPDLLPAWAAGVEYHAGDHVRYEGRPYRVLQAHTSQSDWAPDTAVSLYAQILSPSESGSEEIPEWIQPDSTNGYHAGDRVMHDGSVWESQIDNNVWEPSGGMPNIWQAVQV